MRKIFRGLVLCLLLSACAPSAKDGAPEQKKEIPPAQTESSQTVDEQARVLSRMHLQWKKETDVLPWKDSDPAAFETAQAYVLGRQGSIALGPIRIEVLSWLLENFKSIRDANPEESEMKQLAQNYLKKEKL